MGIAFPYHLNETGETALAGSDEHIRQMLEQLLFTRPGERVCRPDFGCGLFDLVFGPNSPELAAALRVTIGAAVQRWLGDVIELTGLDVRSEDSTLAVDVHYTVRATGLPATTTLPIPGAV